MSIRKYLIHVRTKINNIDNPEKYININNKIIRILRDKELVKNNYKTLFGKDFQRGGTVDDFKDIIDQFTVEDGNDIAEIQTELDELEHKLEKINKSLGEKVIKAVDIQNDLDIIIKKIKEDF